MNQRLNSKTLIGLFICTGIVLSIYTHSLNRPWIFYDEDAIYNETVSPISSSFLEAVEVIQTFGITNNLSSSNFLYSSNSVNRINLLGIPIRSLTGLFFGKNPFFYHLFNLILHILNTCFVFLILKTFFLNLTFITRLIIILLTLSWACHPAHVESVLLSTNANATLSYLVFFILFYDFLKTRGKNNSKLKPVILPFCFLLPMLMNEYIIALPVILFVYSFCENMKSNSLQQSVKNTIKETYPYLTGFFIYLIYFLLSSYKFSQASPFNSLILFFERIFWLSPQIFFHYIKLIFFPKILSIDQTSFVLFGESLFDPYAIFCFLFMFLWLLVPLILFLKNKKTYWLLITSWLFFISIMPFSQFLSPTYCMAAERYLYTPIFFIVFGIALALSQEFLNSKAVIKYLITGFLSLIILLLSVRSYIRTSDWKDNISLIKSTVETSCNDLYKGWRIKALSKEMRAHNLNKAKKYSIKGQNYYYTALKHLKKEKYTNEPLILKSYGLDNESLLIKTIHLISYNTFTDPEDDYRKYLKLFNRYEKYLDRFDPKTLEVYANLLIKNGEIDRSKKIFLYAYERFPTSPFILLSLIRFEREIDKNLNRAKKYLTEGLKLYPYSREILFETLRYYQLENNLAEYARHSYLYGLRAHSKFTYHEALTGFLTLGDLTNAKKTTDKLLKLDPNDPKTLYLSGSYYIKKQDYNQALALLNQAYSIIRQSGSDEQLAFNITNTIAHLYLALGNTTESLHFANEALNYTKNNPENLVRVKKFINTIGISP
ncbi:MAG: hypothetical protein A3I68_02610 [Candidatus Melainabacteria bacterium RIFCSPLOWO2_02_FULL_35_15]|nr:MAG: hypothetical protein A3F80_00220 [Candidatus Melainabacteria bacterium RIFCSPLOWO2_12_FULL_35_11]OGI13023.1 MAG: hypothetical protein A3I68_02610 [Candidatus Melainabacteria bacterium RIFCSPLOWO2_02_FULL_35_15]